MTLTQATKKILLDDPFYGFILMSLNKRFDTEHVDTAGVTVHGVGYEMLVNPVFWNILNDEQQIQVLKHELLHICFFHLMHWSEYSDKRTANIAADAEVNQYLNLDVLRTVPGGCIDILKEIPGTKPKAGMRYYYDLIVQTMKDNENSSRSMDECDAEEECTDSSLQGSDHEEQEDSDADDNDEGQDSCSEDNEDEKEDKNPDEKKDTDEIEDTDDSEKESEENEKDDEEGWDDEDEEESSSHDDYPQNSIENGVHNHGTWETDNAFNGLSESEKELVSNQLDQIMISAAESVHKGHGTIPSEMQEYIGNLLKPKPPVFNWTGYFRNMMGTAFEYTKKNTRKRPSKRFEDAQGKRQVQKARILVGIDTSGSVDSRELKDFFTEINNLVKLGIGVDIAECDARIHRIYEYKGIFDGTVSGRGGTSFSPVAEYYNKNRHRYTSLVYFTDGYGNLDFTINGPSVWVITSDGLHQDYPGKAVYIPEDYYKDDEQ